MAEQKGDRIPGIGELRTRLQAVLGEYYAVDGPVGDGGFAVVFRVRDHSLKRTLAVKVISPELIQTRTLVERFQREAETIAQLSHAHIVPVHFVGHQDDLFYLAMAFVEGESLADRLVREMRLPVHEAARIFGEVASALDLAHRRGVIHRDVKPQNVLIESGSGRALLTDFGIARTEQREQLTATGMVLGTPAYMSPEQVTGETVDHRSDLYSLGIMAYEMLTGRSPFAGTTPRELLVRRVTEAAEPVERVNPEIPEDLATLVNRCVAPDPAERVQSATEIVEVLEGLRATAVTHPVAHDRTSRRQSKWLWAAASGLAVVLAGAALAMLLARDGTQQSELPGPFFPPAMVLIPGGMYVIGRDDGHVFSRPAHEVVLDSFAIDSTEVTVASYLEFMDSTGTVAPWDELPDPTFPVTRVTWSEAGAFCAWRYAGGRLPSEEEWEAAARGPSAFIYPWGDTWREGAANTASASIGGPVAVASFPEGRSTQGVYDLVGNVWEWTRSRMAPYPGGSAPEDGASHFVIRGGAYDVPDDPAQAVRLGFPPEAVADATRRGYLPPTPARRADFDKTGFRCVVPIRPPEAGS